MPTGTVLIFSLDEGRTEEGIDVARTRMMTAEEFSGGLRAFVGTDAKTPLELGNPRFYAYRPELTQAYVTNRAGDDDSVLLGEQAEQK